MAGMAFFGDEVTAAGMRLAGVRAFSPTATELVTRIAEAREDSDIIMLTTEYAGQLPDSLKQELELSAKPLVVFLPDAPGRQGLPDLERAVRRVLGIEA